MYFLFTSLSLTLAHIFKGFLGIKSMDLLMLVLVVVVVVDVDVVVVVEEEEEEVKVSMN